MGFDEQISSIIQQTDPPFSALSPSDKLAACEAWLENASSSSASDRSFVQLYLELQGERQQLQGTRQQLLKTRQQRDKRSLLSLQSRYPALHDQTLSGFYFPTNHPDADVIELPVSKELLNSFSEEFITHEMLSKSDYVRTSKVNCDSESEPVKYVTLLLEAVLQGFGLSDIIEVAMNRTLAGVECDILLIYKPNRFPFAPLEIKKPPNTPDERNDLWHGKKDQNNSNKRSNRVAGESWAQLHSVQLFGFDEVYVMISTHNQFRLVCKGDRDKPLEMKDVNEEIESMKKALEEFRGRCKEPIESDGKVCGISPAVQGIKYASSTDNVDVDDNLKLYGSSIVPDLVDEENPMKKIEESGNEITQLVCLFVLKSLVKLKGFLTTNPTGYQILLNKRMPCRILKDGEDHFAFGTWRPTNELNTRSYNPNLETIYVIHHIGMGGSAHCCLGTSKQGTSVCAIKFYNKEMVEDFINAEFDNWSAIYGEHDYGPPMCRLVRSASRHPCLVMPYLRPIPQEKRQNLLDDGTIRNVLETFAKRGYIHNDMKWRHFGYWNDQIYLLDLGVVKKLDLSSLEKDNEIDEWATTSIKTLQNCLGNRASATETPKKRTVSVDEQKISRKKLSTEREKA